MKDQTWWWRFLNVVGRVFGIWCGIISAGFIFWGIGVYSFFGVEPTAEIKLNQPIYIAAGIFSLITAIAFMVVKPYRPDLKNDDDMKHIKQRKTRWWTGDLV